MPLKCTVQGGAIIIGTEAITRAGDAYLSLGQEIIVTPSNRSFAWNLGEKVLAAIGPMSALPTQIELLFRNSPEYKLILKCRITILMPGNHKICVWREFSPERYTRDEDSRSLHTDIIGPLVRELASRADAVAKKYPKQAIIIADLIADLPR
jgi:hypothetical protein